VTFVQGIVWERVATWNRSLGIERLNKDIIWPGNTRIPPTDKGLPGKTTFRIGFIAPTHPDLAGLAQLGKEFQAALNVAVEMMNKDLSLSVDFDVKVQEVGKDPASDCKIAADRLAKDDVVAVIGAYRSDCSSAAAKVFGKLKCAN
jgi:ABC-type branched-subunit amino acid transport system substrate-binding protein